MRIQIKIPVSVISACFLLNVAAWAAEYPGFAKVENFDAITGGNVANLTAAAKYTNNQPDSIRFLTSLYYSRSPGADSAVQVMGAPKTPTRIWVRWPGGKTNIVDLAPNAREIEISNNE